MFLKELSQYSIQGLRVFVYVSSMGSVAEAAAALGLTQPAVSLQIHNLEKQLGFSLFERQGRKNVLTASGQDLFQKLLPHLEGLEQILLDTREAEHVKRPKIFMGSVEGVGEFWLGKRFSEFSKKHPDARLFCELAAPDVLESHLLTGRTSMIITPRKFEHPRVVSEVLIEERLAPVGRKKQIQLLKDALDVAAKNPRFWEKIEWLGYGDVNSSESWAVKWLEYQGILVDRRLKYRHLMNSYVLMKQFLLDGKGIGVAPMHTCNDEIQSGELVALESKKYPALKNRLYLNYREGSLNSIHQEFKDSIMAKSSL